VIYGKVDWAVSEASARRACDVLLFRKELINFGINWIEFWKSLENIVGKQVFWKTTGYSK
jgi:hypothetical protein